MCLDRSERKGSMPYGEMVMAHSHSCIFKKNRDAWSIVYTYSISFIRVVENTLVLSSIVI